MKSELIATSPKLNHRRTQRCLNHTANESLAIELKFLTSQSREESFLQFYHQTVKSTEMHLEKKFIRTHSSELQANSTHSNNAKKTNRTFYPVKKKLTTS